MSLCTFQITTIFFAYHFTYDFNYSYDSNYYVHILSRNCRQSMQGCQLESFKNRFRIQTLYLFTLFLKFSSQLPPIPKESRSKLFPSADDTAHFPVTRSDNECNNMKCARCNTKSVCRDKGSGRSR